MTISNHHGVERRDAETVVKQALRELGPQKQAYDFYSELRSRGLSDTSIRRAIRDLVDQNEVEITSNRAIQIRAGAGE